MLSFYINLIQKNDEAQALFLSYLPLPLDSMAPPPPQQTPSKAPSTMTPTSGGVGTSPGLEGARGGEGAPTLRVMRLYPRKIWVDDGAKKGFRSTSTLVVPEAFGKIYKGQKFSAYVSVTNTTQSSLRDVQISVKLHSPSSKRGVELRDAYSEDNRAQIVEIPERWTEEEASYKRPERRKSNPAATLAPGEHVDCVVEHQMLEAGTHTMRVSVAYADGGSLRKFYRFAVAEPIGIATKAIRVEHANQRRKGEPVAYVEAVLENRMHLSCIFDKVVLHPAPGSTSMDITLGRSSPDEDDDNFVAYDHSEETKQGDCRKLHFAIFGDDDEDAGWLKIGWTSSTGEDGFVSTSRIALEQEEQEDGPITTRVLSEIPRNVAVGHRFECECLVTNRTDRELMLQLQWRVEEMPRGIKIFGIAHKNIGRLQPDESARAKVRLRAAEPGFHALSGVRVVDLESQREFQMPILGHLLVTSQLLDTDSLLASTEKNEEKIPAAEDDAEGILSSDDADEAPPNSSSSMRIPVDDDPLAFVV